jgi:hypothetical protein
MFSKPPPPSSGEVSASYADYAPSQALRGKATAMVRPTPSVADYRDTSPEDGGGE